MTVTAISLCQHAAVQLKSRMPHAGRPANAMPEGRVVWRRVLQRSAGRNPECRFCAPLLTGYGVRATHVHLAWQPFGPTSACTSGFTHPEHARPRAALPPRRAPAAAARVASGCAPPPARPRQPTAAPAVCLMCLRAGEFLLQVCPLGCKLAMCLQVIISALQNGAACSGCSQPAVTLLATCAGSEHPRLSRCH